MPGRDGYQGIGMDLKEACAAVVTRESGQMAVKLGLCPIGKFVFSHDDAMRQKAAIQQRPRDWQVDVVDFDRVLPDGMVRDQKQVDPVVAYFKKQDIDAVLVPHCDFRTEGVVGMVCKQLASPYCSGGPGPRYDN